MSTLFTQIIEGKIPSHTLLEDDYFYSFLDINPISPGHTLVIPKVETDYFFDLSDDTLSSILTFSKPLASAIKKTVSCKRIGLMVAGLEVPHAHLHLVPITKTSQLSFDYAKPASNQELKEYCEKIRITFDISCNYLLSIL